MTEEKKRGFAALSPEEHRAICSKGGKASHAKGTGNEFDSETGRKAGIKGGHSHSIEHFREIGRKGGRAKRRKKTDDTKKETDE